MRSRSCLSQSSVSAAARRIWTSNGGLAVAAVVVGLGAGLGAIVFRTLIQLATVAFSGQPDYSDAGHALLPWGRFLGIGFVVLVPVAAGLLYGPLVARFAPEARGHGVPEVMLAVANHGGRIRSRVAVVKALASAICIGGGGSVGREGPIVQIGSAIGSTVGRMLSAPERVLRILVACGAAGGIAATFNAPIAGVFFALELILQDFATASFGVVVLSAVVASVVGRAVFGSAPFLSLPAFSVHSPWEALPYVILGLLGGVVGVVFTRTLYATEDLADRIWRGRPEWLRPVAGGLLLGTLLLALPQLYGVGYPVLSHAIAGQYILGMLVVLLAGKIVATSLTIGIGGSGGVFAPSLFMGAMLGTAVGDIGHMVAPGMVTSAGPYGLIGMGAVFAGAARAPITAVMIIFELTGDYTVILPLMASIVLAVAVSSRLSGESTIYTTKLRRRGITLRRARVVSVMGSLHVSQAMRPAPLATGSSTPARELRARLAGGNGVVVVVGDDREYVGVLPARRLTETSDDDIDRATAGDLAEYFPLLEPENTLDDAIHLLADAGDEGLPVADGETGEIVGWLTHLDVLRGYRRHVAKPNLGRAAMAAAKPVLSSQVI
jgi:chloride channel protein, CIC family